MLNTLYVGFKAFYLLEVNSPIKFGHWIQFSNPLDPFIFVFLSVSSSSSPLSWNPVVSGELRWLLPHVWDERRTLKGPEIWITCSEGEIRRRRRRRCRPRRRLSNSNSRTIGIKSDLEVDNFWKKVSDMIWPQARVVGFRLVGNWELIKNFFWVLLLWWLHLKWQSK